MNDVQRHRRPAIWLGAGLPLLVTVVAVGLQLSWWGDLPDPIAVHWTGSTVDGFGSKVMVPWATAILALVFPLIMTVRSEEHTSELQSRENLVCRLLLEKKNDEVDENDDNVELDILADPEEPGI